MDEMKLLEEFRAAVAPPDPRTLTTARARVLGADGAGPARPTGGFHPRRAGWLVSGLGLAAAAVAAAVVMAASPGLLRIAPGNGGHGKTHRAAVSRLSAQQILLAAATTAAAARTGRYWHLKVADPGPAAQNTWQAWYTRDGQEYLLAPNGRQVYRDSGGCDFSVAGRWLTYQQIQRLPTNPAALKSWIIWSMTHGWQPVDPCSRTARPAPPVPSRPRRTPASASSVALVLSNLLADIPAPPAIRAAAFRALASMPDVRRLGQAGGGVVLAVSGPRIPASKFPSGKAPAGDNGVIKLIITPATFVLRGDINYQGTERILAAGWTNRMPPVAPIGRLFPKKGHNG